jgi:hypothetical protein
MPPIETAEEAVQVAEKFVSKYHNFRVLKCVIRKDEVWEVNFDVGLIYTQIVHVEVDSISGNIIKYC